MATEDLEPPKAVSNEGESAEESHLQTLKHSLEENPLVWFLSLLASVFLAGFGSNFALIEVTGRQIVTSQHLERINNQLADGKSSSTEQSHEIRGLESQLESCSNKEQAAQAKLDSVRLDLTAARRNVASLQSVIIGEPLAQESPQQTVLAQFTLNNSESGKFKFRVGDGIYHPIGVSDSIIDSAYFPQEARTPVFDATFLNLGKRTDILTSVVLVLESCWWEIGDGDTKTGDLSIGVQKRYSADIDDLFEITRENYEEPKFATIELVPPVELPPDEPVRVQVQIASKDSIVRLFSFSYFEFRFASSTPARSQNIVIAF